MKRLTSLAVNIVINLIDDAIDQGIAVSYESDGVITDYQIDQLESELRSIGRHLQTLT